jgi:hypothetical protein
MPPTATAPRSPQAPTEPWKAFKNILAETVGPIAVLGIASQKLLSTIASTAMNAKKLQDAINTSSGAEQLRKQFEGIGLSAAQAKQKVEELAQASANGPFNLDSLGAASKNLKIVGGDAVNTAANLKKVADMAAATGSPIDTMATAYARLIASMKGGGGAEAAASLAEMGAISSDTAEKINNITAAGGSFSEKMIALSGDLSKSTGAANALGGTLAGLQAKLASLQANSARNIGDMFIEGEKAALRAQISFQKVKSALDEAASAPFAAISEGFNGIKESIGKFLSSSDSVKGIVLIFNAIFAAAAGIFVTTSVAALGVAATLIRMGSAAFTAAGGMTALNAVTRSWVGLGAGALGFISAIVTALVLFGGRALQTSREVDQLIKKNKELAASGAQGSSKIEAMVPAVKGGTVEDRQKALETADASVDEAKTRLESAQKTQQGESKKDTNWNRAVTMDWFGVAARERQASAEGEVNSASQELNRRKNARSQIAAISSNGLGLDREQLQKNYQRNDIIENSRNAAFERLQGSVDVDSAASMAKSEVERATKKDDKNQIVSKQSYDERTKINNASGKIARSETAQEKEKAFEELKSIETKSESGGIQKQIDYKKSIVGEQTMLESESRASKADLLEKTFARDNLEKRYGSQMQQREKFIKEGGSESGADSLYGPANNNLIQARKDVEVAKQREADINLRKKQIDKRATSEGDVSGKAIQELEVKRDAALKKEDPTISAQQKENAINKSQAAAEALAARNNMVQQSRNKATLESRLASLSSDGSDDEYKINAESGLNRSSNVKALNAAVELKKKADEYNASRGTDQEQKKRKELEVAQVQAAAAGTNGRGAEEIQQELDAEKQITATKLQAAKISESAAKAEYEASMRRLNVEKQISQMKVAQSKSVIEGSEFKGKTEGAINMNGAKKELESQLKALEASKAKDAASAAYKANPNEQNKANLDNANEAASAAGVGNRRTRDLEALVQSSSRDLSAKKEQEATSLAEARDNLKLQSLRTSEKYGATYKERESSRIAADSLEDTKAKHERAAELGKTISDPDQANKLADIEVRRNRVVKDIEREGTIPVSNLARMGGSSGWAGMVNSNENKNKKLEDLNNEQNNLLKRIDETMKQSWNLAKTLSER